MSLDNLPHCPPKPPPQMPIIWFDRNSHTNRNRIVMNECRWAATYPEVQRACYLSRVCLTLSPKACRLKNIRPILQEGPTCGLVALGMLADGNPSPDELLHRARRMNFTRNGEMFSAQNMYELVNSVFSSSSNNNVTKSNASVPFDGQELIRAELYEGSIHSDHIKQVLIGGGCLLVPYDPDFNHGPCLKNGHKAHWALIIGYLIDDNNKFYVWSRHGKTKNIAIWSLKALSASNSNLNEFEQPKGYPNAEFILPDGGIGGKSGLKNKCIIVDGLPFSEVTLK